MSFNIGVKIAAPVCTVFPDRVGARSRCGYDIGTVIAIGKNKRTGKPAVKVRIPVADSVWAKRISQESFIEKWCFSEDCDKV